MAKTEKPTLHPAFPMQTRVRFVKTGSPRLEGRHGTVKGVASIGPFFTYSILMDHPVFVESIGEWVDIISITGCCLEEVPRRTLGPGPLRSVEFSFSLGRKE